MNDTTSTGTQLPQPSWALNTMSTPTLEPLENFDIPITIDELKVLHLAASALPRTSRVSVASKDLVSLRHPDTLGTLIEIRHTENNGLGVFALCDIPPGTALLCEAPLITLIDTGARADPLDVAVNSLSPERQKSFLSLHHFSRNFNESRNRSIVYSNGYSIKSDLATGVFETASRINHSCVPNSHYVWQERFGR
ncbi:hypothetical protein B7463_g12535, partial [Scytalidium lignicola]